MMYEKFGKRIFDICCSFVGLVFCLPVFFITSLAIKLDSKGPILFKQQRMGLHGNVFFLLKFRTMYFNPLKDKLGFEPGSNLRVTRVGKLLRKTKIDELPQLYNVLKGEMSLVGPRPEVQKFRSFYSGPFEKIFNMKPGITDEASLKYRNEEKLLTDSKNPEEMYLNKILPEKLKINYKYVESSLSFKKDFIIILKTIKSLW